MGLKNWAIVKLEPRSNEARKIVTKEPDNHNALRWTTDYKLKRNSAKAFRLINDKREDLKVDLTPTNGITEFYTESDSSRARLFLEYVNSNIISSDTIKRRIIGRNRKVYHYHDRYFDLEAVAVLLPKWGFPVNLEPPRDPRLLFGRVLTSKKRISLFFLREAQGPLHISLDFEVHRGRYSHEAPKVSKLGTDEWGTRQTIQAILRSASRGVGPLSVSLAWIADRI
jgi:hypothetical protein